MSRKPIAGDDGRTVAPMNVEGMPWYRPGSAPTPSSGTGDDPLQDRGNRRALLWGTLKAALLIGAAFVLVYFLFLLFCTKIWFR